MTIEEFQTNLFALFPIGSEWYDRAMDDHVRVEHHVPRRGVLVRNVNAAPELASDLTAISNNDLISGRLHPLTGVIDGVAPEGKNLYQSWADEETETVKSYRKITEGKRVWQ